MERSASARDRARLASVTRWIGGAAGLARALVGRGQFGEPRLQRLMRLRGAVGAGGDLFEVVLQLRQAVELLQAQRGGGGRILGPGAEAVPAPEVAFDADKPLAGLQVGLQRRAFVARSTRPICHRRRASTAGALTWFASGRPRRAGAAARRSPAAPPSPSAPSAATSGARRSSARAAPSAFSKPGCTDSRSRS